MTDSEPRTGRRGIDSSERPTLLVGLAALTGAVSAAMATSVSFLAGVGQTPALLFGHSANFATLLRWHGLPFEFFGLAWFASVLVACRVVKGSPGSAFWTGLFGSSIPATGLGIWLATAAHGPSWFSLVATGCSALILVTAALAAPLATALLLRSMGALARNPRSRFAVLAALLFTVALGQAVRIPIQRISSADAQANSFRRWYAGQPRPARSGLTTPGSVKVVFFTDYMCPFCGSALRAVEGAISKFPASGTRSIELVVRDFPLDRACNPAITELVHPGACLVAAAVRFVRQEKGDAVGHDFSSWCYQSFRKGLSGDAVWDRLRQLGVDQEFRLRFDAMVSEVTSDAVFGQSVGVNRTPVVFVNGIELPSAQFFIDALNVEEARASLAVK